MNITKKEILEFLSGNKKFLFEKFGVTEVSLFGSFARGEETEDSDIDLLYEMKDPDFHKISGFQIFLEEKFNREINIIRNRPGIKPRFLKIISRDLIHVS